MYTNLVKTKKDLDNLFLALWGTHRYFESFWMVIGNFYQIFYYQCMRAYGIKQILLR